MKKITKCLNDWNAIIEALGQGKQTILIRTYGTTLKDFLLFPTTSYVMNQKVEDNFKKEYHEFAKENLLPNRNDNQFEIKYYAKVEKILKNIPNINYFNKYHIWESSHVNKYIRKKHPYVWVLRVYKLEQPLLLKRSQGIRYSNVNKEVSLENLNPVISDEEFEEIFNNLKKFKL